ncbi:MAG TPA: RES family NAD+ phosphorylase [Mucilaginibacter sp.]|jgi:RES domain-containing protein|nr:RES family NAD+ phosphorylase [Mucilaginibacter sp.]
MIVYRLCRKTYANDLSGRGAEISGGRWNSKGIAALYTSSSRALCAIEIIVHVPAGIIPKDYHMVTIDIPDNISIKTMEAKDLPAKWNSNPISLSTQRIGNIFFSEQKEMVLKVPSSIIKEEWNYILNPLHKDFKKIKIINAEPFTFDKRLFNK